MLKLEGKKKKLIRAGLTCEPYFMTETRKEATQ